MAAHDVVEGFAGLASRVDDLVALTTGNDCRQLERDQERLEKLTLALISAQLNASEPLYQEALTAIARANSTIDDTDRAIEKIAETIATIAKALDAAEKLAKKVAAV